MRPVLALAVLLLATPAWAQTRLELSEYATVMVAPDELSGSFTATAEGPSAADIQRRVNETVKAALAAAKSATAAWNARSSSVSTERGCAVMGSIPESGGG